MSKMKSPSQKPILTRWKFWLILLATIFIFLAGAFYSLLSLIEKPDANNDIKSTLPHAISYVHNSTIPMRGKILAVVTSTNKMGISGKKTGYELTELSRAYYVFQANGFEVDIASPLGGNPPVIIDNDDMGKFDYAFLNDSKAQAKVTNTISLTNINPNNYQAVYFVGGKGTMFDFPDNPSIHSIVKNIYENEGVIGAVCHGPAALLNVTLSNGVSLLEGRTVSAFTNSEELFLIPDAETIFPFLLESQLVKSGAIHQKAQDYMRQTSVDGRIVTGQNPWSVWETAELMIKQLGYQPTSRDVTNEENAIHILMTYNAEGYDSAVTTVRSLIEQKQPVKRNLVLMHSIVAAMKFEFHDSLNLIRLTSNIKQYQNATTM